MRISYAMLYKKQNFKKNDRVKHVETQKLGRIEKISSSSISVIYDDKTKEEYARNDANKVLAIIKADFANARSMSKPQTKTSSAKPKNKEERIETLIKEAIRRKEIEEDDAEIKRLELSAYSDEDLAEYEKQLHESYDESEFEEENTERTDAEKALDALRSSGKVSFDIAQPLETSSRSLKEAKLDHEYNMQEANAMITKDNFTKDGLTFDFGLEQLKEKMMPKQASFTRPSEHPMQNLHGITKPIAQISQEQNFKNMLSNIEWTTIGR